MLKEFVAFRVMRAGFYRWFIKNFSLVARPLISLLAKDVLFNFHDDCLKSINLD